jgi:hypothetical protein
LDGGSTSMNARSRESLRASTWAVLAVHYH